jgi:hypothetical protein
MWYVIGGRRIRGEVLVLGGMLVMLVLGAALGLDPKTGALVALFAVLVLGANALLGQRKGRVDGGSASRSPSSENADGP